MITRIGGWLLANGWAIELLFLVVIASAIGLTGLAAYGVIRLGRRAGDAVAVRWHGRRHVPAAPDNQPGRDADLLWACRRIATGTANQPREEKP